MTYVRYPLAALLLTLFGAGNSAPAPEGMRQVDGGEYRPLYLSKDSPLESVDRFYMDSHPVTNKADRKSVV